MKLCACINAQEVKHKTLSNRSLGVVLHVLNSVLFRPSVGRKVKYLPYMFTQRNVLRAHHVLRTHEEHKVPSPVEVTVLTRR